MIGVDDPITNPNPDRILNNLGNYKPGNSGRIQGIPCKINNTASENQMATCRCLAVAWLA